MNSITPQALYQKFSAGEKLLLLDVRTECEHREVHVPGTVLKPLDTLNPAHVQAELAPSALAPLYVLCRSGARARQAIDKLASAGVRPCVLVEGGTQAWSQAGYPVVRGQGPVLSLERQVRVAAGGMVLLGTLLGAFVHPGFLVLPGWAGAGLIFAGLTDKCGMALLLAYMPWNRAPKSASCCNVPAKS